jgi:transcription initiation factor TFIID subunit 8
MAKTVQVFAESARRREPIPTDYELMLKRFNLTTGALEPHRKPPIPRSKRIPQWKSLDIDPSHEDLTMPILGDELNGATDKTARSFIPSSFPSFPSIHTYKYTPETVESVTVSEDWGAYNPDSATQTVTASQSQTQTQATRPLAPDEIPRGDPKKIREAAAKEAKYGEEALRRLMRASKIAKQKEVWSTAQQETARKERYDLWEAAMRELIEDDQKAKGNTLAPAAVHGAMGRFEIADHSMIVNSDGRYARKEMQRQAGAAARNMKAPQGGEGIVGKG